MINLAGVKDCDKTIREELLIAKIPIIEKIKDKHTEVPYSIIGVLGGWYTTFDPFETFESLKTPEIYTNFYRFIFTRAWYYWVVSGSVPLVVAKELYADEYGKKDIRVTGHCGCPPPDEKHPKSGRYYWATPYDGVLAEESGYLSINSYHIDSQIGLCRFVEALRKHGLDKRPLQFVDSDKGFETKD
jgi:hypothetical protein